MSFGFSEVRSVERIGMEIYDPPRQGLPFLVVELRVDGSVIATAHATLKEAALHKIAASEAQMDAMSDQPSDHGLARFLQ